MIKKLLGIRRLENNIGNVHRLMGQHWGHTNALYDSHNKLNQKVTELEQRFEQKTDKILGMIDSILRQLENGAEEKEAPVVIREEVAAPRQVGKNDDILLKILHENAAFSDDASIVTTELYNNLPFSITMRGLRKKLSALEDNGLIASKKVGNERYWHIRTGSLSRVKGLLRARNSE